MAHLVRMLRIDVSEILYVFHWREGRHRPRILNTMNCAATIFMRCPYDDTRHGKTHLSKEIYVYFDPDTIGLKITQFRFRVIIC